MSRYPAIDEHYILRETIGSGGFAKVKVAEHRLTGETVAIKIMDKAGLGDDLPRAKLEIQTLKGLQHQHICQLYEVVETEEKIFMVLEHAPGGEVFDYIVARDRLKEEEARQFFRQILSAVGYIHERGFAHRDLKPENLLLDANNQIKLIDFGLVAHPGHINDLLHTCCGSPAYAAPELITGNPYLGTEADVWSLGVLLYALLCGFLPFDDDNTAYLYRLIQKGKYDIPSWLSRESVEIIGQMLQTNPRYRITVPQLLNHPWVCKSYGVPVSYVTRISLDNIDSDAIAIMAKRYGQSFELMRELITQWNFDHTTATYFLLMKQKREGRTPQFKMPPPSRLPLGVGSPINLRRHMRPSSVPIGLADQYFSIESLPDIVIDHDMTPTTPGPLSAPLHGSPVIHRLKAEAAGSVHRSQSVDFDSPAFNENVIPSNTSAKTQTLPPLTRDARAASVDARLHQLASNTPPGRRRSIFSKIKSVFRKSASGGNFPARPRKLKGLYDVSSTSTRAPEEVLGELVRVIELKGILYRTKGYLIRCKTVHPVTRRVELAFDFEVCTLPKMDLIGVKRKRVKGDTWAYKKVCEELLSSAQL